MCMSRVTETLTPTRKTRVGYKKFWTGGRDETTHRVEFLEFAVRDEHKVIRGQWMKAKGWNIYISSGVSYDAGFHAMAKPSRYNNFPVLLRGIRTIGVQGGKKCFVADEIFIPKSTQKIFRGKVVQRKTGRVVKESLL